MTRYALQKNINPLPPPPSLQYTMNLGIDAIPVLTHRDPLFPRTRQWVWSWGSIIRGFSFSPEIIVKSLFTQKKKKSPHIHLEFLIQPKFILIQPLNHPPIYLVKTQFFHSHPPHLFSILFFFPRFFFFRILIIVDLVAGRVCYHPARLSHRHVTIQ